MSEFYLSCDTSNEDEIRYANKSGFRKITSNPKLMSETNLTLPKLIEIVDSCKNIDYVSVEPAISNRESERFIKEAIQLNSLSNKVVIKVPCTPEGYQVLIFLKEQKIKVNMTLCFSISQAVMAIALGADYVSFFVGRTEDEYNRRHNLKKGTSSQQSYVPILKSIAEIIRIQNSNTLIIAASLRNREHVEQSILAGSHVLTIPPKVVKTDMLIHQQTVDGLKAFKVE